MCPVKINLAVYVLSEKDTFLYGNTNKSYNRTLLNIMTFTQVYKAESKINFLNHQYTINFLNLYFERNMNERISIPQEYLYYLTLGE
jgi:hypothetical protein